jgi:hypothetical protein
MGRSMDGVRCIINRTCDGSHGCCIEQNFLVSDSGFLSWFV